MKNVQKFTRARETREGWPLLNVETEVNGDSKRTQEWGPFLFGSLACRAGTRDFLQPWLLLSAQNQIYFLFLILHCFNSFVPIAQQAGQAAVLGRLSLSVCPCLATHGTPSKFRSKSIVNFTFLVQDFMFIVRKYP
jgi:hypothetical protein